MMKIKIIIGYNRDNHDYTDNDTNNNNDNSFRNNKDNEIINFGNVNVGTS